MKKLFLFLLLTTQFSWAQSQSETSMVLRTAQIFLRVNPDSNTIHHAQSFLNDARLVLYSPNLACWDFHWTADFEIVHLTKGQTHRYPIHSKNGDLKEMRDKIPNLEKDDFLIFRNFNLYLADEIFHPHDLVFEVLG